MRCRNRRACAPAPEPAAERREAEKLPAKEESEAVGDSGRASAAADSTLRVDVHLLNQMMNLVGELVLTRNQVLQATLADPRMTLLGRRLDMVTADLRESVMKARMQPVENVFSKVPRMVRDLSQTLEEAGAAGVRGAGHGTGQEPAGGDQGSADARGAQRHGSRD